MEIEKALKLFELSDITTETEESLKAKFRQLSKKYHPDNLRTGDKEKFQEISKALETIKDTLNKLKRYNALNFDNPSLLNIVLPLDKLVFLYKGGTVNIGDKAVDRAVMKKNNAFIISEVIVTHNGIQTVFDNVQYWNVNDTYSVDCIIYVDNITDIENLKIRVLNKEKEIDLKYQSLNLIFTLDFNIKVNVKIEKKMIKKENNV